jgi:hypothetical protein
VIRDIDTLHRYVMDLRNEFGDSRVVTAEWQVKATEETEPSDLPALDMAHHWYINGMESVFLQDSDALSIGASELERILRHLRTTFPWIKRVTSYSRSSTVLRTPIEDMRALKEAGLDRLHVGMESGSDTVLKLVKKGASKDIHIRAGLRVKEAGIELSEYVMPGLGGRLLSREHALETADALNRINPEFIRLRQLALSGRAPLRQESIEGRFEMCTDIEIAQELIALLEHLGEVTSVLTSDHVLNLFPEIVGKLPDGREQMTSALRDFLSLSPSDQRLYTLGRRISVFSRVCDVRDSLKASRVRAWASDNEISDENLAEFLDRLLQNFI